MGTACRAPTFWAEVAARRLDWRTIFLATDLEPLRPEILIIPILSGTAKWGSGRQRRSDDAGGRRHEVTHQEASAAFYQDVLRRAGFQVKTEDLHVVQDVWLEKSALRHAAEEPLALLLEATM